MNDIKIIDNFISNEEHDIIYKTMISNSFPWYAANILSDDDANLRINKLDNLEFVHHFFLDLMYPSQYIELIRPIINKINPKSLVRIRAAMIPRRDYIEADAYHVDVEDYGCKTGIYYVNTNNGYTKFESGQMVESVQNRFIEFDSNMCHTGSLTTDSKYRILINFNYY